MLIMNRTLLDKAMTVVFASFLLILATSCVNRKYELTEEKLNLEVTLFQEGVALPLGSTDRIMVKDAISKLDTGILKYINSYESGAYYLGMADTFDLTDSLASLKDMIKLDKIDFSNTFEFELQDVNVDGLSIGPFEYPYEQPLDDFIGKLQLDTDVKENMTIPAGLHEQGLSPDMQSFDLGQQEFSDALVTLPKGFVLPDAIERNDNPIVLDQNDLTPLANLLGGEVELITGFDSEERENPYKVEVTYVLPEGIRSVSEIILKEGAKVKVTAELLQSFFQSGSIFAHITDLDVSKFLYLTDDENEETLTPNHITEDFELNAGNGYSASAIYGIKAIALQDDDWATTEDGRLMLDKSEVVSVKGDIEYKDITTTTNIIDALSKSGNNEVILHITLEFFDFEIEKVKMEVDPVEITESQEFEIKYDSSQSVLPEQVENVKSVTFTDDSEIDLSISVTNLDRMEGLDMELESIRLEFPEGVDVEGASNNVLVLEGGNLSSGLERSICIKGLAPSEGISDLQDFTSIVKVTAAMTVGGTIDSSLLPQTADEDLVINVNIDGYLAVKDFVAKVKEFNYPVEPISYTIKEEVSQTLKDMGEIKVYPEGNPVITVTVQKPETSLALVGSSETGLTIRFPDMLRFKSPTPKEYDPATHSLKFTGEIPELIELPVDYILVTPALDETDGKYYVTGSVDIEGGVGIASGFISKADFDALTAPDVKVAMNAVIPELKPSDISVGLYQSSINEEFAFEMIDTESIPEMLVSVGEITLADVVMNLKVDASALPDVGDAALNFDMYVTLPEMIKVEESRLEAGKLKVTGTLNDKKEIVVEPIQIKSLDLTGVDLRSDALSKEKIALDGTIKIENASLNVDQWLGKSHSIDVIAEICSRDSETIDIDKVNCNVDWQLDPVEMSIDLSSLAETLNGDNLTAVLDLNRFSIVLDVETNLSVPVGAKLKLTPYKDGVADPEAEIERSIELKMAESSKTPVSTKYWISNVQDGKPADYEYVEMDLLGLVRSLPDSISLSLTAGTDADKVCTFELQADYILTADYALDLPLEFGKDFLIEFRDTIPDLPEMLGTILSYGSLALVGDITTDIPLELEMTANLLDVDGNVIELAENAGHQIIRPCNLDGSPVTTDLNILMGIKRGQTIPEVGSLELVFRATSAKVPGVPVCEETFLLANLKALIPEGVTVDLREVEGLFDEEDDEDIDNE